MLVAIKVDIRIMTMSAMRKPSGVPVKITAENHAKLQEWAKDEQRPMADIINTLIEKYDREKFWQGVTEDLNRLRADPVAWQDYMDEMNLLQGGGLTGAANEEPYFTLDEEEAIRAEARRS